MMIALISLGQRIRRRREILQITQRALAIALGLTPQHISLIENDKAAPSLSILPGLAEQLGVTIDYLLTGKQSAIADSMSAIRADDSLSLKAKRGLISIIEEMRDTYQP
jgi:transcriptional regulator with XRE-family HTH domain